ncbi:MAG: hypothetical protein RLZZ383_2066, partial [Pseudomonadota bacterium]
MEFAAERRDLVNRPLRQKTNEIVGRLQRAQGSAHASAMLLCSGVRVRRWLEVVLDRIVTRAVRAAVEALYPPSRNGAPDGVDTDL